MGDQNGFSYYSVSRVLLVLGALERGRRSFHPSLNVRAGIIHHAKRRVDHNPTCESETTGDTRGRCFLHKQQPRPETVFKLERHAFFERSNPKTYAALPLDDFVIREVARNGTRCKTRCAQQCAVEPTSAHRLSIALRVEKNKNTEFAGLQTNLYTTVLPCVVGSGKQKITSLDERFTTYC